MDRLSGHLESAAHTSKNGFSAFFVDRKSSFYDVFEHIQGRTAYRSTPFLRRKWPPTRFRLLQNLQNLHFPMCLSTSRTCTPLKHRTKTPPRPQNDRFWCLRNRFYRGGACRSQKRHPKGIFMKQILMGKSRLSKSRISRFFGVGPAGDLLDIKNHSFL